MPPRQEEEKRARMYLNVLMEFPHSHLQHDRIRWVSAWLAALPAEDARRRAMGEERYNLLVWTCYESPSVVVVAGKLRAG